MYRRLSAPISVQIEITQRCNVTCLHCYNYFRHDDDPWVTLSNDAIDKIADDLERHQVIRGVITGGEPFMKQKQVFRMIEGMRRSGMVVTVNTNLTLFTEKIGESLKNMGVQGILTSIVADTADVHDKVTQNPGSLQKTIDGIKLARQLGFNVSVNMVLTKWNIDRVEQTGDLVGKLGVPKFGATRACAPGPIAPCFSENLISIEELRHSLDIMEKLQKRWGYKIDVFEHYPWCAISDIDRFQYLARRKCTAGITSASIGADGQLRPCGHSLKTYGSVPDEGLQTAWFKMDDWRRQTYSNECADCKFFRQCTGGCPVEAGNSSDGKDHHCTGEADVKPPTKKTPLQLVDPDTILQFSRHTVLRKEEFGGTVVSGYGGMSLVDPKTFGILQSKRDSSFTVRGISNEHGIPIGEVLETISRFKIQKLVK